MTKKISKEEANRMAWELDAMAERGEMTPVGPVEHHDVNTPITEDELAEIFTGRPRTELKQPAKKTWYTRTTEAMDLWASESAKKEHMSTSALIRRAVYEYLNSRHPDIRPASAM
ncbi:MAG: hypothetical protein J6575_06160 [Bifidobacterium sp.]|nr:hypothetical protein [Bifidobacterium sp.]